jgi:hypothetical protein
VREAFAHEAVLAMDAGADERAPAAAITLAVCGDLEHEPPCPLAPHHTATERAGDEVRLRTLFVVESPREAEVRRLIDTALSAGHVETKHGSGRWELRTTSASPVRPDEADHARRLAAS